MNPGVAEMINSSSSAFAPAALNDSAARSESATMCSSHWSDAGLARSGWPDADVAEEPRCRFSSSIRSIHPIQKER